MYLLKENCNTLVKKKNNNSYYVLQIIHAYVLLLLLSIGCIFENLILTFMECVRTETNQQIVLQIFKRGFIYIDEAGMPIFRTKDSEVLINLFLLVPP